MKIILISVGTRGDMEPFLPIGEMLKEKGHEVICAFPEQFRSLAEDSNLTFASLGSKFIALLESEDGKAAMGGSSGIKKFIAYIKLAINQSDPNKELANKQYQLIEREHPDRIIYNGKAVYPILWELKNSGKTTFLSPLPYMHFVKGHTHVAFNSNFGTFFNKLTFSLAHFGMVTTVMMTRKWLKVKHKISRKQVRNILKNGKCIYTISPSLFSRPGYWNQNLKVLGYNEKKKNDNWHPDKDLTEFIERHDKILFITFGSMINPEPEKKTKIFLDILEKNKIPAIINTASGGLVPPDKFDPEQVHFVSQVPYDRIFPKVYGVIHHGGSGTTHLALKYGCATMIIPHIIDQFVWDKIIYDIGAGPKGIKISNISQKALEPKVLELINNSDFKKKAERIGDQMNKEDFKTELYSSIVE
ncbi:glycosyltransferase family 1 protein [Fulvivirga sp. M361]|uniref:glycosyltransferase n=1 Tax=Fulvivirga sp. M361 TaxID=2594266 RepID=UPI00117A56C7|nr:glycosyltransferase [Fulvivirga sp. M361]TRX58857.1 glycosyltransferase family 1 protein [Fulvivirga sp. M361]